MNITKEDVELMKEVSEQREKAIKEQRENEAERKKELLDVINIKLPEPLQSVAKGLNLKEMRAFKEKNIINLKEKKTEKGMTVLSNDEVIFDVVVPLLEMRGVKEEDLGDIEGADYFSFYRRVEALTNNPKIQDEIEKKN